MTVYRASDTPPWAGAQIGILVLDERVPRVPGSVGHLDTFSYPVRYKKIPGATVERLLMKHDRSMRDSFIEAAIELRREGAFAIVGCCGFMALFQQDVAAAVDVPVMMSSLSQIPFIEAALPVARKIGVITANAGSLTDELLRCAGAANASSRLCVYGLENCLEARGALLEEKGTLDEAALRREVLETASQMASEHPGLGAILLECSELPPYAADVHRATGLPVFDFVTMIDSLNAAMRPRTWAV